MPISRIRRTLRRELGPMLQLAGPVVLAELGWVGMGIVDTVIVGPLGPRAIGAVGISSIVFLTLAIFGMGLLLGLDTLVAQSYGAGRLDACHRWLLDGVMLGALVTVPLGAIGIGLVLSMPAWGLHPDVLTLAAPYLRNVMWSLLPLMLYAAFRRYLQALNLVRPVTVALVTANVLNALACWAIVYGRLGVPRLGVPGAAWATVIARIYMAVVLLVAIVLHDRRHATGLRQIPFGFSARRLSQLARLGWPAAVQVTLEMGVFGAATTLVGRLDPVSLASHQIALNLASFTFTIPLAISSAGAVRVGHAVGRRDPSGARAAGWTAIALGASFMSCAAVAFLFLPGVLLRVFTSDERVVVTGTALLFVAAIFQLFDGLQAVTTGVLRGIGDTRTPMVANLAGHWAIGLPVGYWLCFHAQWGVVGIWVGLSIGLISTGLVLVRTWARAAIQPVV